MKINDIHEGFWDSLAAGMGAQASANTIAAHNRAKVDPKKLQVDRAAQTTADSKKANGDAAAAAAAAAADATRAADQRKNNANQVKTTKRADFDRAFNDKIQRITAIAKSEIQNNQITTTDLGKMIASHKWAIRPGQIPLLLQAISKELTKQGVTVTQPVKPGQATAPQAPTTTLNPTAPGPNITQADQQILSYGTPIGGIGPGNPAYDGLYKSVVNQAQQQSQQPPAAANESRISLTEGGNIFPDVGPIKKEYVSGVIQQIKKIIPNSITVIPNIGSAGFKSESGDMDVFVDSDQVSKAFNVPDEKQARRALKQYIESKGFESAQTGRNVHVKIPVPGMGRLGGFVQVDVMVIKDAARVAEFHQHGLTGQYDNPNFKGGQLMMVYASLARALGLKFSPFEGNLIDRQTNQIVANTKDKVAKILLNPHATAADLSSIDAILKALANDPLKDEKLAQARQDQSKGLLSLPESSNLGNSNWFRQLSNMIGAKQ